MKLPFAAESRNEIGASTFLFIAALLITIMFPTAVAFVFLLLVGAIWVVILRFFRDPHRQIPPDQDVYLSPADGRVVMIDTVDEPDLMKGQAKKVAIFMSLTDVHVNRAPITGEVILSRHVPGKFLQAFKEQASLVNEHHLVGIRDGSQKVLVRQVAGIMARRVVCRMQVGDHLEAGERLGMIKFGSRVELYLPPTSIVQVEIGQRVRAGESIIARKMA